MHMFICGCNSVIDMLVYGAAHYTCRCTDILAHLYLPMCTCILVGTWVYLYTCKCPGVLGLYVCGEGCTCCILAGAQVYLACRSVVKGEAASAQIEARTGLPAAQHAPVMKLDLSSLTSVRNFVSEFKRREYNTNDLFTLRNQESIPVGCIPPALYHRGFLYPGGWALCPGRSLCPGRDLCPGGSLSRGVSVQGVSVLLGDSLSGRLPPLCGQTDACENITLPQTIFTTTGP